MYQNKKRDRGQMRKTKPKTIRVKRRGKRK